VNADQLGDRFDFIDQFRGAAIVFLILSVIVEPLASKMLVPSLYTHGFLFNDLGKMQWNWMQLENQFITWIDLGASIFMVISASCLAISFPASVKRIGTKRAMLRVLLRYAIFVLFQVLFDAITGHVPFTYRRILLGQQGFFTRLGIGTVVGSLALLLLKKPARRIWWAIVLLGIHGFLYLLPPLAPFHANSSPAELASITWAGDGTFFDYYAIPFEALSFAALSIIGTCLWDWLNMETPFNSFKKYHVPVGIYSWLVSFVVSWFIPFESDDLVVSQTLLAVGMACFLFVFFFCMERVIHFKVPLLSAFGKNGLLIYMSSVIILVMLVQLGIYDKITSEDAWLGMILVISVFAALAGLATLLDKRKQYLHI